MSPGVPFRSGTTTRRECAPKSVKVAKNPLRDKSSKKY